LSKRRIPDENVVPPQIRLNLSPRVSVYSTTSYG
jgi:hypothetical protein